jgi:LuxR family maltose regulon positive regulatory protein
MMEEAVEYLTANHLQVGLAPALALLALIYRARDQRSRALTVLGQAVEIAARGGIMRSLLDFGPELIGLLYELKLPGSAGDHVAALLAAATTTPIAVPAVGQKAPAIEPLTTRELAVLELVAANLSDKEIAVALCISPLTVRKHTTNIFAKLQVRNRREAAALASQLRLVTRPPDTRR